MRVCGLNWQAAVRVVIKCGLQVASPPCNPFILAHVCRPRCEHEADGRLTALALLYGGAGREPWVFANGGRAAA